MIDVWSNLRATPWWIHDELGHIAVFKLDVSGAERPSVERSFSHMPIVTPGFKDKTECISICMPGLSFIHIETF